MIENINSPKDIKNLNINDMETLSREIRETIVHTVSKNGGHLASNLGIVEATLVLHKVFDTPNDKIVFDVGHQCYAHKMLTGRFKNFDSLRQKDGISGFTNIFESEYDTLTAGHSGSSISASLGLATAMKLRGEENSVVCVVGDGSFTNGMIYEALNNCNNKNLNLIIVLNDNEMSISSNVGSLAGYLSNIRTSRKYFKFKRNFQNNLSKVPYVGDGIINISRKAKNAVKGLILKKDAFFNTMGVKYFGPVDGNDIARLEAVMTEAKKCKTCCLVHMKTQKGFGYDHALSHPENYHSVGKFNVDEGVCGSGKECFSNEFGKLMCEYAKNDEKICAISAAMCEGTGLLDFSMQYPDRFFDVGIAEEHEIAFSGGLSVKGLLPVCAVYSTFAQRTYDQVFHDVSIQGQRVVLALDRAGFVADDGITHQGIFDVALFSSIPDVKIYSPDSYTQLKECFDKALYKDENVSIVRYPKGAQIQYDRDVFVQKCDGDYEVFGNTDAPLCVVTYGKATYNACLCAKKLIDEGIDTKIVKLIKVYPVNENLPDELKCAKSILFVEEGIRAGGISEKIQSMLFEEGISAKTKVCAVDNKYVPHASVDQLYEMFGLDENSLYKSAKEILK